MAKKAGQRLTNRKKKALKTREKLFRTAIRLFAKKGYDNVTVDEIVAKARASKGAFYTHFTSKDQIVVEQFKEIDRHYLRVIKELGGYTSASAKLLAFVREQQEFITRELGLEVVRVLYQNQLTKDRREKILMEESRVLYRLVEEIVREGQEKDEFRRDIPPSELTKMITRCMRGAFFDWCVRDGDFDLIKDGESFFRVLLEGILRRS